MRVWICEEVGSMELELELGEAHKWGGRKETKRQGAWGRVLSIMCKL